ncbi:MAG: endopeptidase La [Alphaproteobacteria bacterium]|nr:endopeptidase La [Alphaproteobacteria bacterium]
MQKQEMMLPILPLRDIVIFPKMVVPLFVGREKSMAALDMVMSGRFDHIILLTQKNIDIDVPDTDDLYSVGVIGKILQMLKLPDGTIKVLVEGTERFDVSHVHHQDDVLFGWGVERQSLPFQDLSSHQQDKISADLIEKFEQFVKISKKVPLDVMITLHQIDALEKLVDTISSYMPLSLEKKQDLLAQFQLEERYHILLDAIHEEINVLNVDKKIRGRVKTQMEKSQREYYLNEQLKAIHKELGGEGDPREELRELESQIKKLDLSKEAREKAFSELKKLKSMNPTSAEASVVRNYLEWLLGIPWNKKSAIKKDLSKAEESLNADHFGLDKVKERILEYLAVQNRVGKIKSQIICLVGPPGVGKTSLGKSIAAATGRQYVRMALGGVRDESEIRGHRRTYIGSMPGKIIQGMKKAKTSNPLFLLDEIDKISSDWRGDPASALLEVLDPEQNNTFNDHYLEVDYDLSDVMFVTTANTLNMPQPLLDRMEIIRLSGYTEAEKVEIAKNYLIPKQLKLHGLKPKELSISPDAISDIIRLYTREAGVRSLEREISKIARKVVRFFALNTKEKSVSITSDDLENYLGIKKFKYGVVEEEDQIGVTTGLAWTEFGGDMLSIETIAVPGKGKVQITGKLGDVMQESVQAAVSYVRSRAVSLGIKPSLFDKRDLHIHVPEGAIPKDGPSAGITITTALVSTLTGIPVHRDFAMTGEVTLRGRVLPIGGLKEKLLAAHRGQIKKIIIPDQNKKDLRDIPQNIKDGLEIFSVKSMDEVLSLALVRKPEPIHWSEDEEEKADFLKKQMLLKNLPEAIH